MGMPTKPLGLPAYYLTHYLNLYYYYVPLFSIKIDGL